MTGWDEAARALVFSAAGHLLVCTVAVGCAALFACTLRRGSPALRHCVWMCAAVAFLVPFGALRNIGSALGRLLPAIPVPAAAPDFSALLRYGGVQAVTPADSPYHGLWLIAMLLWAAGTLLFVARFASALSARPAAFRPPDAAEREAARRAALALGLRRPVPVVVTAGPGAPAAAGLFHHVLLLPESLRAHLEDEEFTSVLMHEMAHLRRRDNLAAAVARAAVSLFWFFPLAWWVERKLAAERELACDEAVLRGGIPAPHYASGLLKTCGLCYAGVPAGAAAATGSNLTRRMEAVMSFSNRNRSGFAARLAAAGMFAALIAAPIASGLWTQASTSAQAPEKRKGAEFIKAEILGTPSNHEDHLATLSALFSLPETELPPGASVYAKWINEDVAYIITPAEREVFLRLSTDEERERFIEQFWRRRNPDGRLAAQNRFKEEHYRRIDYANRRYSKQDVPGWKTDRGRLYIVMGPPDEVESHPAERYEKWLYRRFDDTPDKLLITFGGI